MENMNRKDKIEFLKKIAKGVPATKNIIDLDKCSVDDLNRLLSFNRKGFSRIDELPKEDADFVKSLPTKTVLNLPAVGTKN